MEPPAPQFGWAQQAMPSCRLLMSGDGDHGQDDLTASLLHLFHRGGLEVCTELAALFAMSLKAGWRTGIVAESALIRATSSKAA